MQPLFDTVTACRDFLEAGGDVLVAILFVTFLVWTFILERFRTCAAATGTRCGR